MKFSKTAIVFIFIGIFFGSCTVTGRLTAVYLEERRTVSVENSSAPYFWIMVFTPNNVETIHFNELEKFKAKNPDYSFLVPKDKEDYYNKEIAKSSIKPTFRFEVEQISEERQLIKLTSTAGKSFGRDSYEATDKEVFPKKSSEFNLLDATITIGAGLFGGTIVFLICFFIYKKFFEANLLL